MWVSSFCTLFWKSVGSYRFALCPCFLLIDGLEDELPQMEVEEFRFVSMSDTKELGAVRA